MSTSDQKAADKLRKKSAKELEEMATARAKGPMSAESVDEPVALVSCPSETSMNKLNNDLKKVPIVKDFNSAENHLEDPDKKK